MVFQLDRPGKGDGVVLPFRRQRRPFVSGLFPLHGLDASSADRDSLSPRMNRRRWGPGVPVDRRNAAGMGDAAIEFLLALGSHRFMTRSEIEAKPSPAVAARYPVHNHDWKDPADCELIGTTAQGVEIWIKRRVARADLVVGVGCIMPIEVSGFTSGGKILVPGVCGKPTNDDMHPARMDVPYGQVVGRCDNLVRGHRDGVLTHTDSLPSAT
jgi:hypothetical protein